MSVSSSLLLLLPRVWRPQGFEESNDGHPLATTLSDLWVQFPYHRLPTTTTTTTSSYHHSYISFSSSSMVVAWCMRPEIMLSLILFYLIASKPLLRQIIKVTTDSSTSNSLASNQVFISWVALHNLCLAIFSAIVVYNSCPIVFSHWQQRGWESTYCDQDGSLWKNGLGAWSTIFYISKYVEFVDTWILVLKGKKPSFLQVYHHAGIVFTMWGAVASQSAWLSFVVILNSFIHTLMYTYFFIKTISPQTEIKAARYLTTAQIVQFYTGILGTLGVLIMGERCDTRSSRFMLACLDTYGIGLIILFTTFAAKKYKSK